MLNLTLLGTGGGMPMPNRFLSSLCIEYKGRKILVDCGEGTQVSIRMCNLGFKSIDVLCISHIHGDHILGLPGLLSTIGNSGREEDLLIVGPEGIREVINGLMTVNKYLPYKINIIENSKDDIEIFNGEITINTLILDHTSPCIGYSFNVRRSAQFDVSKAKSNNVPLILWNKLQRSVGNSINYNGKIYTKDMVMGSERKGIKLSFITDTRPLESIIHFAKDSNLLVCEGTYGKDEDINKAIKNKHMTFREAAKLAKESHVSELLLTHFSTAMSEPSIYIENAKDEFNNVIIGYDRMKKELYFNNEACYR